MRFAICNETFVDWECEPAFAFAAECGYTGIEIAPFTLDTDAKNISAVRRTQVRRQAESAGLEVVGLHWLLAKTTGGYYLTSPDMAVRRRTVEYLCELARLCRDVGGSRMIFGSPQQRNILPGVTPEQAFDYAAEVVEQFLPVLEETEVTLCLEPLGPVEGNFLVTSDEAVRLIERVAHPQCRLILDCKAMSSESVSIPELVHRHASLLHHFHANDPNRQGPGFGELDFVPILEALGEIDYRGWVSVEVFDYSPGVERLARESIDNLKQSLAEVA